MSTRERSITSWSNPRENVWRKPISEASDVFVVMWTNKSYCVGLVRLNSIYPNKVEIVKCIPKIYASLHVAQEAADAWIHGMDGARDGLVWTHVVDVMRKNSFEVLESEIQEKNDRLNKLLQMVRSDLAHRVYKDIEEHKKERENAEKSRVNTD